MNFTDFGKDFYRGWNVGEVVEDFGVIGREEFHGKQEIRLLRCSNDNEVFYVLELTRSRFLSKQTDWIKLGNDTVQNLRTMLN